MKTLKYNSERQKYVQTLQPLTEVARADTATHFTFMHTHFQEVLRKVDLCQARVFPCSHIQRKLVKLSNMLCFVLQVIPNNNT